MHSTEHAVMEVEDRILTEPDIGNTPLATFLDLSKDFDKLKYYGIKDEELACTAKNIAFTHICKGA